MKRFIHVLLALLVFGGATDSASAQYPERPIKMIVSALPGAATDVLARIIADRLKEQLGQTVFVENKPGASSMIAAEQLAQANPDGYTVMISPNSLLIAPHMLPRHSGGSVDVINDIVPVIETGATPITLLAYPGLDVKTVAELLVLARRGPELTYASGGIGSALHLAGELFQKSAGVKLVHIPYKGLAGATTDVVAGRVNLMFGTAGGVMGEMISRGKLTALAVADKERSPLLPNVPTLSEAAIDGADLDAWFMMFAPAKTPRDILMQLNAATARVLAIPEVRQRLIALGVVAGGGSVEDALSRVRKDYKRYGEIVLAAGIAPK